MTGQQFFLELVLTTFELPMTAERQYLLELALVKTELAKEEPQSLWGQDSWRRKNASFSWNWSQRQRGWQEQQSTSPTVD